MKHRVVVATAAAAADDDDDNVDRLPRFVSSCSDEAATWSNDVISCNATNMATTTTTETEPLIFISLYNIKHSTILQASIVIIILSPNFPELHLTYFVLI